MTEGSNPDSANCVYVTSICYGNTLYPSLPVREFNIRL